MANNRITSLAQELLDVIVNAEGDAAEHLAAILLVSDAIRQAIARQEGLEELQRSIERARHMYKMFGVVFSNYNPAKERKN